MTNVKAQMPNKVQKFKVKGLGLRDPYRSPSDVKRYGHRCRNRLTRFWISFGIWILAFGL